ncbi:hypothetical protein POM88_024870 [Heracleum sosnowskyi]|uniref:F-box domain-containing protein n=1 Tax=Heracleum sosnowskyi TaxID=360622 RepID=A0AAD8I373_9APIA|nr:hypothetical protein POM88_024870 [Heracleum sosnowskyi]
MNGIKVIGLLSLSVPLLVIVARCYYQPKYKHKKRFQKQEEQVELEEKERVEEEEGKEVIINGDIKVSWSELDPNLLGEILSKLCLTDQARFLVVCKNWLAAAHSIINSSATNKLSLPWHGVLVSGSSQVQIYDPLSSSPNHPASLQTISWSKFGIPSPTVSTVSLYVVENNWLHICIQKSKLFFWTRRYFVLFSPFTKKIITLPKFDYTRRFRFSSTFSTQPDSPDCVFCLMHTENAKKIAVATYRNGDKEWTAREFDTDPDFIPCRCHPAILDGILYIVSRSGQVASYNILHGEFNFDYLFLDDLFLQNAFCANRKMKVFVLNGELVILYFNWNAKNDATLPGQQFVRRYDRSAKVWVPVRTLADYALFFSEKIIDVSLIDTKDRRYNGVLSNKIYHFSNGGCLVYSLEEDGNLVLFKSINSNMSEDGGGELPEYKYNYGLPELGYWLEAPCVRSSSHNQGKL